MPRPLSVKQQQLLDYLEHAINTRGQSPSLRQAAADLGVSHAAVSQGLKILEEKGYLKREGRYSRTIYPAQPGPAGCRPPSLARSSHRRSGYSRAAHVCPAGVGRHPGAG